MGRRGGSIGSANARTSGAAGFTLAELAAVAGCVALLAAILVPVLGRAIERSRVTRAVADLRAAEIALEAYAVDHKGGYPAVETSCQGADADEVLQLPRELGEGGYLPKREGEKTGSTMRDPFHRAGTYKYVAPEGYWLNGQRMADRYPVWVPEDFPACKSGAGRLHDEANAPLAWAVWSVGPGGDAMKTDSRAPLWRGGWYGADGRREGAIVRFKPRDGAARCSWP